MKIEITRYGSRNWAVHVDDDLLCVTLYLKGARAVAHALRRATEGEPTPGVCPALVLIIRNPNMKSYKTEVCCQGSWCCNSLRFATKAEAEAAGRELLTRWTVPTDSRATETEDPVDAVTDSNGRGELISMVTAA